MQSNHSKRSRAFWALGFIILGAALGLGLLARPAAARPFAYVANGGSNTVSVIDTATNMVVATVPVGVFPFGELPLTPTGVAVAPDGKHAYVIAHTFARDTAYQVIDTATNTIVATVPFRGDFVPGVAVSPDGKFLYFTIDGAVGTVLRFDLATNTEGDGISLGANEEPIGVAITPDGKHVYATTEGPYNVAVIDTATFTLATTVNVPLGAGSVAVTPDGKHVYVTSTSFTSLGSNNVSVIDTATNTVEPTVITVGTNPVAIAVTPDGKRAFVANESSNTVSVIETAANKVLATVPVGNSPNGVAVTPDGKRAYVANLTDGTVSVIDTATNTVLATVTVGSLPVAIGIIPDIPLAALSGTLTISLGKTPNTDSFLLKSSFTLGSTSTGINPPAMPVTFQVGTLALTIPPGSFTGTVTSSAFGPFFFAGTINGVSLHAAIAPTGAKRFSFQAGSQNASLTGTVNPVPVTLTIANNSGTASITANIASGVATAH
ncbi:MAG: beta-propeller fold lactonase family protein [Methylocella sp.]